MFAESIRRWCGYQKCLWVVSPCVCVSVCLFVSVSLRLVCYEDDDLDKVYTASFCILLPGIDITKAALVAPP